MKKIVLILLFLLISLIFPAYTQAEIKASGSSAVLARTEISSLEDARVKILRGYLKQYNSPLTPSAETFVRAADKYGLDWKFVAAISGVESTFGKAIPYNSYNAWGWGVYGNNVTYFESFDQGIEIISESLRRDYMDTWGAEDVHSIGKIYAASPTWSQKVTYFMNSIDKYSLSKPEKLLSISI